MIPADDSAVAEYFTRRTVLIDITERMRLEQLIAAQNKVLQLVASESSLPRILAELVRHIEAGSEEAIASILLVDAEARCGYSKMDGRPCCVGDLLARKRKRTA